jgi:hypothetical protein
VYRLRSPIDSRSTMVAGRLIDVGLKAPNAYGVGRPRPGTRQGIGRGSIRRR